ncbi:unnamed protein product [Ambrosiozyma monospora]|uniref:Unnamed protein product n=1 Tax=Ambrosiozyma monospora TaxID=43982 RepID=A0A9W7DKV6_AMBMO|nr:unnamed protein product [Ambrosiozyma monospora]
MIVDLGRFLSHELDPTQVAELSRVLNSPFGLKRFMEDYFKNQGKITVRDLVTREAIEVLTLSGCFILPNAEKCQRYIEMFFKVFYVSYPLLAKQSFMTKNTGDRYCDPESLLLLRSVIYMGCAHCAETEEEKKECKILYEKAKLLLSANLESNGICLVSSMIILMCAPEVRLSLESPVDQLYTVIQVARLFGMDRDVEKSTRLSQEDKSLYKILFWVLVFKDRLHSLVSAKDYYMDISDCNVKMLAPEDFTHLAMDNPEYSYKVFSWSAAMGHLMDRVTDLQKRANIAALKCQPFMSYVNDINAFIEEFFVAIIKAHDMYSNIYGQQWLSLMYLFVMSLSLSVQRANLCRLYVVCERAIQNETVTKGSSLYLELELEELCEMKCCEYLQQTGHILCYFVSGLLLKFKNQLFFSQSTLYLCYQAAICVIPFLFDPDEDIRNSSAKDLDTIVPVLNQAKSFNTWQITEFFSFILNDIIPDENKLVNFARCAFNVNGVEKLWKAASGPDFKLIRTIMESNLPPLRTPFMEVPHASVNTTKKDSTDVAFSLDDETYQTISKLFIDPSFDIMQDTPSVQLGDSRAYSDLLIGINKHVTARKLDSTKPQKPKCSISTFLKNLDTLGKRCFFFKLPESTTDKYFPTSPENFADNKSIIPENKVQENTEIRTLLNTENRIPSTRAHKWKSVEPPALPFSKTQSSGLPFGNNGLTGQHLPLPNFNQHPNYPSHPLPPLSLNPSLAPPPPQPPAFQYPPITNPTDPLTVNNVNSIGKNQPIVGFPVPISNINNNFQNGHFNNNNVNNNNMNNNINSSGNASINASRTRLLSISELTTDSPSPGSTPTSLLNGIPHISSSSSTTIDSSNIGTNVISSNGIPSIQSEVRSWAPQQYPASKNPLISNESHGSMNTTPGINSISPSSELSGGTVNSINSMNNNNGGDGSRLHPPPRLNFDHMPYLGMNE